MRITVPEEHFAIIVARQELSEDQHQGLDAGELKNLCHLLRRGKPFSPEDKKAMRAIAGDILLAIIEGEEQLR